MNSPGKPLNLGDDSRRNWLAINRNADAIRNLIREVVALREAVARIERPRTAPTDARLPFTVYRKGPTLRDVEDLDWWQKFYVRHGYCNGFATTGCDDADGEGTSATEILPPLGTESVPALYYVWVEITLSGTEVTAAEMKHGSTPWTGYPDPGVDSGTVYVLLARLSLTDTEATIRQFQRGDIVIAGAGGGGGATWV